jgi:hypothetical protein
MKAGRVVGSDVSVQGGGSTMYEVARLMRL